MVLGIKKIMLTEMKSIFRKISVLLLTVSFGSVWGQNLLRVNNTAGVNTPYTTIAAAVTAAGPSDIIMVEGSLVNYGDIVITKKVNIVGPGYFLTENTGLQATVQSAVVNGITLNSGADGSSISGLRFGLANPAVMVNGVSNISISNSYFPVVTNGEGIRLTGTGSNIFVKGNYFDNSWIAINTTGSYNGVIISNNYIIHIFTGSTSLFTVTNNIITSNDASLQNADIRNNIFTYSGYGPINNATGSIIKYNVFGSSSQSGADGTNTFSASPTSLFIGASGNTTDTQWKLKSGSPAINAGESGVDCGMYGGSTPYKPSGIQSGQLTITNIAKPSTVPQNGILNVKVSAKVN
jgi:hypothetical protein